MRWIPVSERLPEKEGWYLVVYKLNIGLRHFENEHFYCDTYPVSSITHWMPLPELPVENDRPESHA
jgi:hypothetical protein